MHTAQQLFGLQGRVALVTGGSRGLGLEIAAGLAAMGARLAISARKPEDLDAAREQLQAQGTEVLTVANDLAAPEGPRQLADAVLAHYGAVDVLVNNAGRGWAEPAEQMPPERLRQLMRLNAESPFELSAELARRSMIPRGWGRVINVASILGLRTRMPAGARPPMAAYATSKAAAVHMTRALAAEWGRYGITVNAIAPGPFPSRMNSSLGTVEADFISRTPTGRLGRDGDLRGAAIFFASDAAAHVTGQVLAVDGGQSLVM